MPFETEAKPQTNDDKVLSLVKEIVDFEKQLKLSDVTKMSNNYLSFYFDQLYDKDRGYWCKNAFVKMDDGKRAAFRYLKNPVF